MLLFTATDTFSDTDVTDTFLDLPHVRKDPKNTRQWELGGVSRGGKKKKDS